ncbi:MAG: hypothetical protein M0Q44_00420 [Methylobacter sp.]|nr:hypothetical protein [Methylobacter sp.]
MSTESMIDPSGPLVSSLVKEHLQHVILYLADGIQLCAAVLIGLAAAFKRPVKVINDAAMQALGNYKHGKMLFLGLGTGLGSVMIVDGIVVPMKLAHLPYKKATYEDYVGVRGLKKKHGKKRWRRHVVDVVERLIAALEPDDVVLGGGNVNNLKELPPGCRASDNTKAFIGGFRLWANADGGRRPVNKARPS